MALTNEQKERLKALSPEDRKELLALYKDEGGTDPDIMATISGFQAWQKKVSGHLKLTDAGDPIAPAPAPAPSKKTLLDHALDALGL